VITEGTVLLDGLTPRQLTRAGAAVLFVGCLLHGTSFDLMGTDVVNFP
jgi:hypothetical protein